MIRAGVHELCSGRNFPLLELHTIATSLEALSRLVEDFLWMGLANVNRPLFRQRFGRPFLGGGALAALAGLLFVIVLDPALERELHRAPGALPGRIRADIGTVPAAPVKKLPAFSQRHPEHRADVHAWLELSAGVFNVH